MNQEIIISGVGGQGVLFITRLLAEAFIADKSHVLTSETHGMAQRGGIVISHLKAGEFNSPLIRPGHGDLLIALKAEILDHHKGFLKENGKAVVNASASEQKNFSSSPARIYGIDADFLAETDHLPGSVNLYMLGAAMAAAPACPPEKVKAQIQKRLAGKKPDIIQSAVSAFERGFSTLKP
ncbi:MAG: 2-oxoacid:acceptor oxidoreductase family protein [Thermodesulfobacteriota bacterium]|nr:2-oxoacid:acceptor oxidoreductase family protein [Thermodesulfobacteriota bacterium]